MEYDLKIEGGTIADGTGGPLARGDIGIRDGRIVAIGEAPGSARRTIAAEGHIVCPGFIDIHTHYDAQVMWDRMLTVSPWHGVTTAILGNCGFGVAPTRPAHRAMLIATLEKVEGMSREAIELGLGAEWPFETFPQYLDAIEARGVAINVGVMIGHTPVRLYVMGEAAVERAATDDEIAAMRRIVREAIDAGAIGFATSKSLTHLGFAGKPVPSRLATTAEILALVTALGEAGRGTLQATIGPGMLFAEMAEMVRASGRPMTWSALLTGIMGPGSHRFFLEESARLIAQGLPIAPQASCRPLVFEFHFAEPYVFESLPSFVALATASAAARRAAYADPGFRAALRQALVTGPFAGCFDRMVVAYHPTQPALEEQSVRDLAARAGRDIVDYCLDLALADDLRPRFRMAMLNHDETELAEILTHPAIVLGLSDAGAHASQLCDACFSTHLLGHWVRERAVLSLERAVWLLTGRAAELFGLRDRGRVALGLAGDLVVFDPKTVAAGKLRRVQDQPAGAERLIVDAHGIRAVIVGGTLLREDGRDVIDPKGPLPGRVLRG
ncbi:MAG: D-aminoacylase domain protein [Deltaproteobacteria bacterium]|nr:D-aminoacylase domain protein [Deltaproteobacteria bacterium]